MLGVLLLDILSLLVQAAAPGRRLNRGLGAQSLEPPGSWDSWLEGDWGPRGKRQGAAGRPQHWGHHREELGHGQLPQVLGPARDLTPEHPHPVWNHRDHLEHLGRQKGQSGLRRIGISGLVPSPLEQHSPPLP